MNGLWDADVVQGMPETPAPGLPDGIRQQGRINRPMDTTFEIFIPGVARPQGSHVAFMPKGGKRPIVREDQKATHKTWRDKIDSLAKEAWEGRDLLDGPLRMELCFVRERPASDFNSKGQIKPSAKPFPDTIPDLSKLLRALEDALKSVVIKDDARFTTINMSKRFGRKPGADILIYPDDSVVPSY